MRVINAEELMKLYEAPKDMPEWDGFVVPISVVIQNILDMPTLEVEEVRHGVWIAKNIDATSTLFTCSNCQREVEAMNDYCGKPTEHIATIYPYCHCGTKMDKL